MKPMSAFGDAFGRLTRGAEGVLGQLLTHEALRYDRLWAGTIHCPLSESCSDMRVPLSPDVRK